MILITGSTGLLGSHILLKLLQKGKTLRALQRKYSRLDLVKKVFHYYVPEQADTLFQKIEWIEGDILEIPSLEEAFKGVHEVYHAAGKVSFGRREKTLLKKINVEGTTNVVNLCIDQKVEKLCYISSVATLDEIMPEGCITEDSSFDRTKNHQPYAYSKHLAEMEVWRGSQEGVGIVIANPSVILASGFWQESSGMLFEQVRRRGSFYTDGSTGYVDARDVAECCIRLMDENHLGKRYILNSANPSYEEVIQHIRKRLDLPPAKIISRNALKWISRLSGIKLLISGRDNPLSAGMVQSLTTKNCYSNERIRRVLNYKFISVKAALDGHLDRYKKEQFS
ncbi:MAG: NAD-dependent epimerase/dehydratase family protein [Flavobacteriales bacterium AspAUS03]